MILRALVHPVVLPCMHLDCSGRVQKAIHGRELKIKDSRKLHFPGCVELGLLCTTWIRPLGGYDKDTRGGIYVARVNRFRTRVFRQSCLGDLP